MEGAYLDIYIVAKNFKETVTTHLNNLNSLRSL